MWLENLLYRMTPHEAVEDARVLENRQPIEQGQLKEVVRGIRQDVLFPIEDDPFLEKVHEDLNGSARVVNTWIHPGRSGDLVHQDYLEDDFHTAILDHGLDEAVRQAVKVEESFIDQGYVYTDLKPENLRFFQRKGYAIDYLDERAVRPLEEVELGDALARSYDLFVEELGSSVPGLEADQVEKLVDSHSSYTEAYGFTGSPYMDFVESKD